MKTNIKIRITSTNNDKYIDEFFSRYHYFTVKLDKEKFPYIVIHNEKYIINSTTFPQYICFIDPGDLKLELIEGLEELKQILSNSDLTIDKLTVKDIFRLLNRNK